jgi:hypothetical protein
MYTGVICQWVQSASPIMSPANKPGKKKQKKKNKKRKQKKEKKKRKKQTKQNETEQAAGAVAWINRAIDEVEAGSGRCQRSSSSVISTRNQLFQRLVFG